MRLLVLVYRYAICRLSPRGLKKRCILLTEKSKFDAAAKVCYYYCYYLTVKSEIVKLRVAPFAAPEFVGHRQSMTSRMPVVTLSHYFSLESDESSRIISKFCNTWPFSLLCTHDP